MFNAGFYETMHYQNDKDILGAEVTQFSTVSTDDPRLTKELEVCFRILIWDSDQSSKY